MRDRGRHRLEAATPREQLLRTFPFQLFDPWLSSRSDGIRQPDRRSGFFQEERQNDGEADAVQQRLERRLVVFELHLRQAAATRSRIQPKTGASSALKVKFRKLTTPVAVPLTSGGLASLITVYGSIAAPDAMPATSPSDVGREHVGAAEEDPGEAREQDDAAGDDHRLAPADPIRDEPEQRAADDPPERHRRRAQHRGGVVDAARLLQVADAPDHVEDRRRDEQQAGDHPAEDRLRIAEDQWRARVPPLQPVVASLRPASTPAAARRAAR